MRGSDGDGPLPTLVQGPAVQNFMRSVAGALTETGRFRELGSKLHL